MAMPLPLEGDGLIENLFYFLWCKDDFGSGPSIFIPHTVLYKSTQPSAWYFTSRKSGKIKRKAKINLNNAQIEHALTKRKSATDVVAYHLYLNDHNNAIIEYFDIAALQEFLYRREKTHNGLLQQFVLPKGTSHATIRAIWSPKICLLERRINHKNLYDKRFSVYERAVTFDGADLHSRPEPVRGAMLPGEIQRLCEQVVDHVTQVSYHKYRISRMVLHLKVDADDKIWLLWCSSLRLLNLHALSNASTPIVPRPLDMVSDATVPTHINFRHHHHLDDAQKDEKRRGFVLCTSCGKLTDQTKMLSTNYKAVLEHFARFLSFLRVHVNEMEQTAIEWPPDERLVQAAGGVGFGILPHIERPAGGGGKANRTTTLTPKELVVPPVIQYLHPNLSAQDLERHRTDPIFLHKPVPVCESCCLVYADFTTSALEVNTLRISASVPLIMRPQREVSELRKRLDPLESIELTARGVPGSSPKSTAKKKPPASAWKPIPSSTTTDRQQIKRKVLPTALSNLPTAPQLPLRIDKLDEIAAHSPALSLFLQTEDVGPEKDMRKREESFFRDLYHDKDLEKHHPLHHMLESATRLSHAKKDLHSIKTHMGKTQQHTQSMSALPDVQVKKAFKSPYRVVQRLPDERGEPTKAATTIKHRSKGRQATKNKTGATAHASDAVAEGDEHDEDEGDDGGNKRAMRFISTRENRASKDYQDFLFAALSDAQAQLEEANGLTALVDLPQEDEDEVDHRDNGVNDEQSETEAEGGDHPEIRGDEASTPSERDRRSMDVHEEIDAEERETNEDEFDKLPESDHTDIHAPETQVADETDPMSLPMLFDRDDEEAMQLQEVMTEMIAEVATHEPWESRYLNTPMTVEEDERFGGGPSVVHSAITSVVPEEEEEGKDWRALLESVHEELVKGVVTAASVDGDPLPSWGVGSPHLPTAVEASPNASASASASVSAPSKDSESDVSDGDALLHAADLVTGLDESDKTTPTADHAQAPERIDGEK